MADLLHILPSFPTNSYSHLLPSLEKHLITTTDLITVDAVEIAKRARLPVLDVRNLANAIVAALKLDLSTQVSDNGFSTGRRRSDDIEKRAVLKRNGRALVENWSVISILDEQLNAALGGGIPAGYVTEITGESGAGKTQLLLTLLLSAQLPPPHGLARPVLYISTEASLSTNRLSQLLDKHPYLAPLPQSEKPSLDSVLSINVPDLESQDHILRYQVPVSVRRHKVGLVVIDSVAANYRAEFEARAGGSAGMARRSAELIRLGSLLRDLAREENIAVVVANQVGDRFLSNRPKWTTTTASTTSSITSKPSSSPAIQHSPALPGPANMGFDVLTLDHQQRWFTGWGDDQEADQNLKTPSLGHTWTLQISARIALLKEAVYTGHGETGSGEGSGVRWKRKMKVVFAPWTRPDAEGVEFIVSAEGLKSVTAAE